MIADYMNDDFLLQNKTAQRLYHEYAEKMPIYDYHCHLDAAEIAADKQFATITQAWLYGDHYKWRALRSNGVDEKYCTGDATDTEKFQKWAATVPACIRNPLYHWTHLELKKPFGIKDKLLNPETADEIYEACSEMLQTPDFSVRNIMRSWNVKLVCTTEDPLDNLEHHKAIRDDGFEIAVHTAWRPDKAMAPEDLDAQNAWIDKLAELTNLDIASFADYCEALQKRHDYFHENGCRLSDHGLEAAVAEYSATKSEIEAIFSKIRKRQKLAPIEILQFKSVLMVEFALMDWQKGWVQQLHMGPMRNNNTRMFKQLGPDTGFDSIGDYLTAKPLALFLDALDKTDRLPKTILYNLNPRDNEVLATMLGNFQGSGIPGKMQWGSGWWFLDQMDGITQQMNALSNLGLLSRFIGMLTDSRSFLSYSRHEYFRRILCNLLGDDVEKGLIPNDLELLGGMVEDICFNNAKDYFAMSL
ncbi:MAG: glucuronate isomerase [Planctomycetes bacterium]|nr:glucuronate isomerase [Planctomycetota bacterium]